MHILQTKIKKSYICGVLILIAFLSFSFFSLNQLISYQENNSKLINIAGKQRMLLQKIALHMNFYQDSFGTKKTEKEKQILVTLATDMYNEHLFLVNNNDDLSATVRYLYFVPGELLHEKVKKFTQNAIYATTISNEADVLNYIYDNFSFESVERLLAEVNFVVDQMERHSTESLSLIQQRIIKLWAVVVFGLLIIAFYVFRHINSAMSHIRNEHSQESEQISDFEFAIGQHSMVYRLTPEQKISYANDKFCDFFDLDKKSILNRQYQELGLSDHNFEHLINDESFNQGIKKVCHYEFSYYINGTKQWLDTTIVPIKKNDAVVHYMVIQNEITEQRMMNIALKEVYRIATDSLPLYEKIDSILKVGRGFLKLSNGIVSYINDKNYVVKYSISPKSNIKEGDSLDFANTYCTDTFSSDEPVAYHHVKYSHINQHTCYKTYGLESYIGCKVVVDDKPYGTLNFSCMSPRHRPFTKNHFDFISLLSKWLGIAISQENQKDKILSQQRLMEKMSEQARIGAWEYDLLTQEVTWSDMTKKIHEVSSDFQPNIETAIEFYKGEEKQEEIKQLIHTAIDEGKPFQIETQLLTAKGSSIWVCAHGQAIFEQDQCVRVYGSFQDITAKHNIDIAMADNNRRMKLATDSSAIGIWEYNIIHDELVWDEWMFRLYGVQKKDFDKNNTTLTKYIHVDDKERISNDLQLAINDKKKFNTQFRIVTPSKSERHIQASAIVLRDFNGIPQTMIGVNYDITERVKNEKELIEAKEIAETASKIKNEFLASMSHEIRTPMNGVLGMLNLLSDSHLTKEQQQQVSIAQSSARFLLHVINDILDVSKIDANQLELERITFDIRILIEELVISMAQQAKEKNLEIMFDTIDLVDTEVIGDPNRIRQILINLVGNAIKFTEKGNIVVQAKLISAGESHWRLLLSVKDTGIGIPESKHSTIFENFAQVDSSTTRNFGGTGLGLAIVKRLCECMNGNISLESIENKGTIFFCDIEVQKVEKITCVLPPNYFKELSILSINSHDVSQSILIEQCKQWGVTVKAVDNIEAAMSLCELDYKLHAPVDLILMDTNILTKENLSTVVKFNHDKRFKGIAWIIMTFNDQQEIKQHLTDINYISCLSKPMAHIDLYSILCSFANNDVNNKEHLMIESHTQKLSGVKRLSNINIHLPENIRILLVEDNKVNQMVTKGLLNKVDLSCDIAVTGVEALNILKNTNDDYDLIFMDCQMPEMDGYQATEQIRRGIAGERYCNIPIIAMTANAMSYDREKCLAAGMSDYLSKPIEVDKLFNILNEWLVDVTH